MSDLIKKVAYLQGLSEGLDIDKGTKEGKMFAAILEILEEVVREVEDLSDLQAELESYLEALDEDLGDVEDDVYGEDDYLYDDDEEFIFDDEDDYEEDFDDDDEFVEVVCSCDDEGCSEDKDK